MELTHRCAGDEAGAEKDAPSVASPDPRAARATVRL